MLALHRESISLLPRERREGVAAVLIAQDLSRGLVGLAGDVAPELVERAVADLAGAPVVVKHRRERPVGEDVSAAALRENPQHAEVTQVTLDLGALDPRCGSC